MGLLMLAHGKVAILRSGRFAPNVAAAWYRLTSGQYVGNTSIPVGLLDDRNGLTLATEYFADYKDGTNEVPSDVKQYSEADVEEMIASFTGKAAL